MTNQTAEKLYKYYCALCAEQGITPMQKYKFIGQPEKELREKIWRLI